MPDLFTLAVFVIGLVAGCGLTLCLAALATTSIEPDHNDSEYL
jgi:hypothetical protein